MTAEETRVAYLELEPWVQAGMLTEEEALRLVAKTQTGESIKRLVSQI